MFQRFLPLYSVNDWSVKQKFSLKGELLMIWKSQSAGALLANTSARWSPDVTAVLHTLQVCHTVTRLSDTTFRPVTSVVTNIKSSCVNVWERQLFSLSLSFSLSLPLTHAHTHTRTHTHTHTHTFVFFTFNNTFSFNKMILTETPKLGSI